MYHYLHRPWYTKQSTATLGKNSQICNQFYMESLCYYAFNKCKVQASKVAPRGRYDASCQKVAGPVGGTLPGAAVGCATLGCGAGCCVAVAAANGSGAGVACGAG